MKIVQWMYDKTLTWFKHRHAERNFVGVSFTDSVLCTISSDVMLAPMVVAQPAKALRFATVTTTAFMLCTIYGNLRGWRGLETVALGGVCYYSYD